MSNSCFKYWVYRKEEKRREEKNYNMSKTITKSSLNGSIALLLININQKTFSLYQKSFFLSGYV